VSTSVIVAFHRWRIRNLKVKYSNELTALLEDISRDETERQTLSTALAEATAAEAASKAEAAQAETREAKLLAELQGLIATQHKLTDKLDAFKDSLNVEKRANSGLREQLHSVESNADADKRAQQSRIKEYQRELSGALAQHQQFLQTIADKDAKVSVSEFIR
jgi:chromosome segregation ATPase